LTKHSEALIFYNNGNGNNWKLGLYGFVVMEQDDEHFYRVLNKQLE